MALYVFVDPNVQELMMGNVPPDDVSQYWPVPFGTDINHIYINRNSEVAVLPPKPGEFFEFDYINEVWFDPRTDQEKTDILIRRRNQKQLDKSDLLIRLAVAGILTPEDAEMAAGGVVPPSLAPLMDALPADAQMAARIKWKADNMISRNHPVIVAAAYALGISDAQIDAIFDIQIDGQLT